VTTPLFADLRLPLVCAAMSYASSLPLTLACCRGGVVGGWQGGNVRTIEEFAAFLTAITAAEEQAAHDGTRFAPHAVNIPSSFGRHPELGEAKLALCEAAGIPIVLSSVGDPSEIVRRVHDWGGIVIHDVTTVRHAEKAVAAGVDGLMLTCSGAGGHSGTLTPFAFIPQVRAMYDGLILAGGGIANGAGIAAALALGADLAVMGTRFIATDESGAVDGHKQMITEVRMEEIVFSDVPNGLAANWMAPSMARIGWDPRDLPRKRGARLGADLPDGVRAWRDIWSAGHSAGLIADVSPTSVVIDRLVAEFDAATAGPDWRARLTTHRR
jgi:nitronate monooxygenase